MCDCLLIFKDTRNMKVNFNFRFAVFVTMAIIELHGLDYNDLEATKVACPRFDSCATRKENEDMLRRDCECDDSCVIYRDCCIDANKGSMENGLSCKFTCMPHGTTLSDASYVISTCQRNWQGPVEIKSKCEFLNDLSDPFMARPVTDKQRCITYRNGYCAKCNMVGPNKLSSWNIQIYCNTSIYNAINYTSEDLTYSVDVNEWGITKDNIYYNCPISFGLPRFLQSSVRECKGNLIGTCPRSWQDVDSKKMCESYMAIVLEKGVSFPITLPPKPNRVYRNPHCALCNGVSQDEMECTGIFTKLSSGFGGLIDVNQSDGKIVGMIIPNKPSCPAGQKYDPFITKGCRGSFRLPGQTMKNGECV